MMGFQSTIAPGTPRIDDSNWQEYVGEISVDGKPMSRGLEPRDWDADPFGAVAEPFNLPIIDRSEWDDRLREREKQRASLVHMADYHKIPVKDQNGLSYCWGHGVVRCVELIRAKQGQEYVELEPASVCAPINNYQNRGGWGVAALKYIIEHGVAPVSLWPKNYWRDDRYDTPECREFRKNYRVIEWDEVPTRGRSPREIFDMIATLIFNDRPVAAGFGWWGHLICISDILKDSDYGWGIDNSWSPRWGNNGRGTIFGSKCIPDDIVVSPRVVIAA